ncbi:MAG TPA: LysR substrate-binding domain-containing protein [Candidatus Competibacteraceae bacterium]|nr:LysR substrate-binding domain-containing protein [Candidatus Competibacteraceae bacterium]
MSTTLDIDLLRALVAVVDSGGFTTAAQRLHRTQSAVSMQLRKLEETVGRRLLERGRNGVVATADGELLLGYARQLLSLHDQALATLRADPAVGRVRLGIPDDYAHVFLPEAVARFTACYPRVEVRVDCALSRALEKRLQAGEFDLIVVTRRPGDSSGTTLRREPLVWAAAPGHRPELSDPLPLAMFPEDCAFRPYLLTTLERAGRPWRTAFTSSSLTGVLSAVTCGLALTCLARSTVPSGWRILGPAEGLPPLPAVEIALHMAEPASPAVRALARHLLATLGELPTAA